jgi:hypothetical protein
MVPPVPKPLLVFLPWFCAFAVAPLDADDEVDEPVFEGRPPPWVDVWNTVTVEPPAVVVKMGVDEAGGDEVVGVGVVLVEEGGVDDEGGGVEEVLNIEELEELGVIEEELEITGVGLLLAIELDGGSEVLEGDGVDEEVDAGPVSVLEVELEAIVNCLLKTSFLGCLGAMVSEGTSSQVMS